MEEEDVEEDFGIYEAKVIDNVDPLGLHRVQVHIPRKIERSGWARPVTAGGGGAQTGGHRAPRVGEDVYVMFAHGDPSRPVYLGGPWGSGPRGSQMPADIRDAGKDAHLVHGFELAQLGSVDFRVTLDERPGHRAFKIYAVDRSDGEVVAALELDLERRGVVLYGLTGVDVRSDGFFQATAPVLQLNDRPVLPKAAPI